jgi:hypothetical protein
MMRGDGTVSFANPANEKIPSETVFLDFLPGKTPVKIIPLDNGEIAKFSPLKTSIKIVDVTHAVSFGAML